MRGERSCQKNPHELRAAPRARRRQLLCPAWHLPPWLRSALVPREGPGEPGVCPQEKEVRRRLETPSPASGSPGHCRLCQDRGGGRPGA